jgi:hypothetical protein
MERRTRRSRNSHIWAFITALAVAFVVVSALADRGATVDRDVTGNIIRFEPGQWLYISFARTNPSWAPLRIALNETTIFEGPDQVSFDPAAFRPGMKVKVWYRSTTGDRIRWAEKVRVVTEATRP